MNFTEILSKFQTFDSSLASTRALISHQIQNTKKPVKTRQVYDQLFTGLEDFIQDYNNVTQYLNDIIITCNSSIEKINDINELIHEFKIILNRSKVGTLEGLVRGNISDIPRQSVSDLLRDKPLVKEVYKQPYDEFQAVHNNGPNGGFSKNKKKRKRKRTIKKRHL